jgi:N-hydroxyarylamine O-acetyltransferase
MEQRLDIAAYCARVGYRGPMEPTREALDALHLAHATSIPFENVDIVEGRPIRLDLDSVQSKLVGARRGGYCFEHNTLFAAVLEAARFRVTRLAARVRVPDGAIRARTHMLLAVEADGEALIADVGFGSDGPLLPVPLASPEPVRQFAWRFRVSGEPGGLHAMQTLAPSGWRDLYAFTLEPQYAIDFEVANWYTSTHPESRFVQVLTAQRVSPEHRIALRGFDVVDDDGTAIRTRTLAGLDEQRRVLAEILGIEIGSDSIFRNPGGESAVPENRI